MKTVDCSRLARFSLFLSFKLKPTNNRGSDGFAGGHFQPHRLGPRPGGGGGVFLGKRPYRKRGNGFGGSEKEVPNEDFEVLFWFPPKRTSYIEYRII